MPPKLLPVPLHPIDQFCDDRGVREFKVATFQETSCTATEFEEKHRHEFYEIVWLRDGSGVHEIDLREHRYAGSVIFVLSPGQIHRLRQEVKAEGFVLKFVPELFDPADRFLDTLLDTFLPERTGDCPAIQVPREVQPSLEEIFLSLLDEFRRAETDSAQIYGAYLRILLTRLNRLQRARQCRESLSQDSSYALYRQFRRELERAYHTEHSVAGYASLLGVPARTLNRAARTHYGKTAGELIQERLVLEAQRLLYHDSGSVKEICYTLGFADPAYFTRFFRRRTGQAPQEFREAQGRVRTAG